MKLPSPVLLFFFGFSNYDVSNLSSIVSLRSVIISATPITPLSILYQGRGICRTGPAAIPPIICRRVDDTDSSKSTVTLASIDELTATGHSYAILECAIESSEYVFVRVRERCVTTVIRLLQAIMELPVVQRGVRCAVLCIVRRT